MFADHIGGFVDGLTAGDVGDKVGDAVGGLTGDDVALYMVQVVYGDMAGPVDGYDVPMLEMKS